VKAATLDRVYVKRRTPSDRLTTMGSRRESRWLLAGIVLVAALVRFAGLGSQSFWADEATTHAIVAHGLGHVISSVPRTESTPHMYYVLLWFWSRVFGTDEAGLRSFSALCGTLTVPVVWMVGRKLVSERVGQIAALLVAVSPLMFWLSQETRAYALMVLLSAVSLLAFVHALAVPSRPRLLVWGLVCALALCSHYFAALVVVPETAWLVLTLRKKGVLTPDRILVGLGPVVVAAAALSPLAIHQDDGRASYIASSGSLPYRMAILVKQDTVGYAQPGKLWVALLGAVVVALAAASVLRADAHERRAISPIVAVLVGGLLIAILEALVATDYIDTRNLAATWPALALVAATGLASIRAGRLGALAAVGVLAMSVFGIASVWLDPHNQRNNWRGAARALGKPTTLRAIVSTSSSRMPLLFYIPRAAPYPAYPVPSMQVGEVDVVAADPGMLALSPPPVRSVALPGFTLVQRSERATYTVLRFRARRPQPETKAVLRALYPRPSHAIVLLQRP
jgi:mannosyltransferase